jgi:hypothetical protein
LGNSITQLGDWKKLLNFPQHYDKQEHVLNTNKLIKKVTENAHCTYVNIHDLFTDKDGKLDSRFTFDGLLIKLSGYGYEKWVAYLRKQGYL